MAELLFQYYELWNSSSVADRDASTLELPRQHKSWGKSFQFSSLMYISSLTFDMWFGPNSFGMSVQWRAKGELANNCTKKSTQNPINSKSDKWGGCDGNKYNILLYEHFPTHSKQSFKPTVFMKTIDA